jgi:hypothetical protein
MFIEIKQVTSDHDWVLSIKQSSHVIIFTCNRYDRFQGRALFISNGYKHLNPSDSFRYDNLVEQILKGLHVYRKQNGSVRPRMARMEQPAGYRAFRSQSLSRLWSPIKQYSRVKNPH